MASPRLTRVNPIGDAPTSIDFRKLQDYIEQALKTLANEAVNWISVESAKLFSSLFTNYQQGAEVASFSMDKGGHVRVRGTVTPKSAYIVPVALPMLVFSLPADNAPVKDRRIVVDCSGAYGVVQIYGKFGSTPQQAGQVYLVVGNDPGRLSLDGIEFEAGA